MQAGSSCSPPASGDPPPRPPRPAGPPARPNDPPHRFPSRETEARTFMS